MDQKVPGPLSDIQAPKKFKEAKPPENLPLQNSASPLKSGGGSYPVNFITKSSF